MPLVLDPARRKTRKKKIKKGHGPGNITGKTAEYHLAHLPMEALRFTGRHRIATAVVASLATLVAMGGHELGWLILAVNYDKILTALTTFDSVE